MISTMTSPLLLLLFLSFDGIVAKPAVEANLSTLEEFADIVKDISTNQGEEGDFKDDVTLEGRSPALDKVKRDEDYPPMKYNPLFGKCTGRLTVGGHSYEMCFNDKIDQVHVQSGTVVKLGIAETQRWWKEGGKDIVMYYDGDLCENGRKRHVKIKMLCGQSFKVIKAQEPATCEYYMEVEAQEACQGQGQGIGLRCTGEDSGCCTKDNPCGEGEGDCDFDYQCKDGFACGDNNCDWGQNDDCCTKHPTKRCGGIDDGCCTFEHKCKEGDGGCDYPGECEGYLVCGNNNCEWNDGDDCCEKTDINYVSVGRHGYTSRRYVAGE